MKKLALSDEILLSIDKPVRYLGNELNVVIKDKTAVEVRFAMCFPDVYDIGMSHLGMQILYDMFNQRDDVYCERVYSPWIDLHPIMKEQNIKLFALESQDPIIDFDFLGITLQYEMCYTNILQILDLGKIPMLAKDRTQQHPIVIGGGPCAYNPEPIADFFDIFYIGEGETVYGELIETYKECKKQGKSRKEFLELAASIPGLYVPSFYEVKYKLDGTIESFEPINKHASKTVKKVIMDDVSGTYYNRKPLVPFIKVTQDRVVLEVQRGCIRGCRFCQAGMIYRPLRERNVELLKEVAMEMIEATGHEEISLSSLSTSDYSMLKELIEFLLSDIRSKKVNISLPSLRIDSFSLDVMKKVQDVKKSSLTFAPEAGTQRLRDVINKGLTQENIITGSALAFEGGWNKVKLYFMLGLPTETDEDMEGIAVLSNSIAMKYYEIPKEERNGKVQITASSSFFVPKPFTPFQWDEMYTKEEYLRRARVVKDKFSEQLNRKSLKYNWHEADVTVLEGVFARGDRKISAAIIRAYELGCIYDAWSESFDNDKWMQAFNDTGLDIDFYTLRKREFDEILPWDFIDVGVSKNFLVSERKQAEQAIVTPNCAMRCAGCGAKAFGGGICFEVKE